MKILHVNYSRNDGGAARAVNRLNEALNTSGVHSRIITVDKNKKINLIKKNFSTIVSKLISYINTSNGLNSLGIWGSKRILKEINEHNCDIVHLHWIQHEMLAYKQLQNINKPIIWTLHDMWPFLGCVHYYDPLKPDNYLSKSFDNFLINKKLKSYPKEIQIVAPSLWIAKKARESLLMRNYPIKVIPNIINTEVWKPKYLFKNEFNEIKKYEKIILIGSLSLDKDKRKGYFIIRKILDELLMDKNIKIILFGKEKAEIQNNQLVTYPKINDDEKLRELYSISDVVVVPSLVESFGQVVIEANACGTPVVCFDTSGIGEIVQNGINGFKAVAYDYQDLINKIKQALNLSNKMKKNCIKTVEDMYSYKNCISKYVNLYKQVRSGNYISDI